MRRHDTASPRTTISPGCGGTGPGGRDRRSP